MQVFELVKNKQAADFWLEDQAFEGVKRVAGKAAGDVEKVTGVLPVVQTLDGTEATAFLQEIDERGADLSDTREDAIVFAATVGHSRVVDRLLEQGILSVGNLKRDREVYSFQFAGNVLFILGSDKRGTIYGLFRLSELIGVSPLHYFGDATIVKKDSLELERTNTFSKQPSVKYRGFFINDEWPAFGNWVTDTFGDANAKAYDHIFELLLRMKGNYLWPAMWNSSFSQDGPGLENAILADIYGVIMGTSHHEPLCRAGIEWQQQYRDYGDNNAWSFLENREAITAFWKAGVKRNKTFENVYTIGMRGESDSKLLPEDATMADNVAVVKEAILAQNDILAKELDMPLDQVPRMLAIYKEVEQYYYGDETCEGLKDWDALKDVIFLLSDDNHGNLRALPTEEERKHPGGFGMYYHVDYHGGPISYEWINSTKISKIWEQMTTAYEYGVRTMWIINVGDLKGAEYPLSFFLELAYDYDRYGIQNRDCILTYPKQWVRGLLGERVDDNLVCQATELLNGFVAFNAVRRPEYTNSDVYHPIHYGEGQWVIGETKRLLELADVLHQELPAESLPAYESCIYYPALASLHLHCMNALAGYNHLLAGRGSMAANAVGADALTHLRLMEQAVEDFHKALDGKWNHMMASAHTGFRSWDDYNWTYPVIHQVTPIPCAKALVGFREHDAYHLGAHWQAGAPDCSKKFLRNPGATVTIDVESRGRVEFDYQIVCDCEALSFSKMRGTVRTMETGGESVQIKLSVDQWAGMDSGIGSTTQSDEKGKDRNHRIVTVLVKISFADGTKTEMPLELAVPLKHRKPSGADKAVCFTHDREYLLLDAEDYSENYQVEGEGFEVIPDRGRWRSAVKCFPVNKDFIQNVLKKPEECPYLKYSFGVEHAGAYELIFELVPANPAHLGNRFAFFYGINESKPVLAYGVAEDYNTEYACREWDYGVVNHVRRVVTQVSFAEGNNELKIYPGQPGFMLERILILPAGKKLQSSYLGPQKDR